MGHWIIGLPDSKKAVNSSRWNNTPCLAKRQLLIVLEIFFGEIGKKGQNDPVTMYWHAFYLWQKRIKEKYNWKHENENIFIISYISQWI